MIEFDKGPTQAIARLFAQAPDYTPYKDNFWFDWGPVFYRGRLDRSPRLLCLASDPGPTERLVGRTLVGDAGQRVQGFLKKLGLTRSYLCLNTFLYALFPSKFQEGKQVLADPAHVAWRNRLINRLTGPALQAIVAFGSQAHAAIDLWDRNGAVPVFKVLHPSYRDENELLDSWRQALPQLRLLITPDPGGDPGSPSYGNRFLEEDYASIPKRDLPFGLPSWIGDDSWGRKAHPRHNNCVERPAHDDRHTLVWIAPRGV